MTEKVRNKGSLEALTLLYTTLEKLGLALLVSLFSMSAYAFLNIAKISGMFFVCFILAFLGLLMIEVIIIVKQKKLG